MHAPLAVFPSKLTPLLNRFFLEGTAATYAFSSPEGDLPASIAITFSLFAIFSQQHGSSFIHWSALAFAILSLVWDVKSALGMYRRGSIALDDAESGPLIGGH